MSGATPDERAFQAHLAGAEFRSGEDRGHWRVLSMEWPHAWIEVSAAERSNSPSAFVLRFQLDGYPQQLPTAMPWDLELQAMLDATRRPQGDLVGHVFRTDWEGGRALYAPYDRVALAGHSEWPQRHPTLLWDPARGIAPVLRHIHGLLNSEDYTGVQVA